MEAQLANSLEALERSNVPGTDHRLFYFSAIWPTSGFCFPLCHLGTFPHPLLHISGVRFHLTMREIMVCRLCSSLVIDYRKYDKDEIPSPFVVEEVYPGLAQLSENANDGCEFCHLLGQLMMEYFDVTESGLEKPIRFQLRNARFYTESYGKVIEDDHNSDENRAYMLVMELAYGEASNTRDLFFAVYSNDDCE